MQTTAKARIRVRPAPRSATTFTAMPATVTRKKIQPLALLETARIMNPMAPAALRRQGLLKKRCRKYREAVQKQMTKESLVACEEITISAGHKAKNPKPIMRTDGCQG